VPDDADFVFDARALPNPYWEASLRELTGRDESVARFMAGHDVGPPHDRSACMAAALQAVERDAVEAEKLRADRAETALEAMRKRVLELEAELRKRA